MDAQCLTVAGLILDIAGVIVLFFYPRPEAETYGGIGVEKNTVVGPKGETQGEMELRAVDQRAKAKIISRLGLGLLLAGFGLQLVAQFVGY